MPVAPVPVATPSGSLKAPLPVPSSTATPVEVVTARSSTPSRLKPPTTTDPGLSPTSKKRGAWKVPSPLPSRTETVLSPYPVELATRSGMPSPSKSTTAAASPPTRQSLPASTDDSVRDGEGVGHVQTTQSVTAARNESLAEFLIMSDPPWLGLRLG